MSAGYKALTRAESYCSLNSSSSSREDVTNSPNQRPLIKKKSVYVFRCRYCKETFTSRQNGMEQQCTRAPNYARENVDGLCIVRGYRGCWYHLTKDQLPHEENEDVNILRLEFPPNMAISLWIKFILISIFCFPCVCLWLPFALWEKQTRFVFGPRHSIRRKRKITGAVGPTQNQRQSTSQEPPRKDSQSEPKAPVTSSVTMVTSEKQHVLVRVLEETVPCSEEDNFTNIPLSPFSPGEVHITVEECIPPHGNTASYHGNTEECIPPPPPDQPPPEDDDEDESEGKVQDVGEGVKEDGEKEEEGSREEGGDKEGEEKDEDKEESVKQEHVGKGEVVINFDGIGINVDAEEEMNV
ncbi:uncharacterized protein LOC134818568 [Bolinopsis microptera]|uniref:uncharacterized protein LOC134818568 n=1 Tax=Bolinopsis microptera TaxID=2820187 RepID=UPI003078E929